MNNNPAPLTEAQEYREQAASDAIDMLALYESVSSKLIDFIVALQKAGGAVGCQIEYNLEGMEVIFGNCEYWNIPTPKDTAIMVIEALADKDTEGAKEAIDDHFAGYLRQARALANGEVL